MLIRNSDILGSFGLFCLLCGFRQLGNLFGTDGNGFRIGGGLLSFALGGFFVFFFGLFTVLGLTICVSVFGVAIFVSVFRVTIFVSVLGVAVLGIAVLCITVGTAVGFLLAVCLFLSLFNDLGGLLSLGSLDDLGGLGGGRCGFLSIGHFNSSNCFGLCGIG